jgi:hypothetical protein
MAKESTPQTLWVGKVATVLQYSMQTLFSGSKENGKRIKIPNHSGLESGKVGTIIRQLILFSPRVRFRKGGYCNSPANLLLTAGVELTS